MTDPQSTHFSNFPEFYAHPLIQRLSVNERWSVSGVTDKQQESGQPGGKAPLCLLLLEQGKHVGAKNWSSWRNPPDEAELGAAGSLQDVCEIAPYWPNVAYHIDAWIDGVFAVDIEPDCPDDIKQQFLRTNYIYGEVSMSGKGYHLFYSVNWERFAEAYPIAAKKDHIQSADKSFEVHLSHWITFTRRMIPPCQAPERKTLTDLLIPVFLSAKPSNTGDAPIWNEDLQIDDIPGADLIQRTLTRYLTPYPKTPESVKDMSKYEFGHVGYLYRQLLICIGRTPVLRANRYTTDQLLLLLYSLAVDRIPYRPKHDTERFGLPWLLWLCQDNMAKNPDLYRKYLGYDPAPPSDSDSNNKTVQS